MKKEEDDESKPGSSGLEVRAYENAMAVMWIGRQGGGARGKWKIKVQWIFLVLEYSRIAV